MRHLALRDLFPALIKAELHRVFTIKLEINTFFTPKATHSINIDDTVVCKIFITSEFMMSLVPTWKTAISVVTSASFKVGRI